VTFCQKREPLILFVDDEKEICFTMAKLIKPSGYDTMATTDPYEAISIAKKNEVDIAVIDYLMPQMNGIDLVKELVKEDPRILCIILTAHGSVEDCNLAYQAGIVRYIEKPARAETLKKTFRELLARKESAVPPLAEFARLVSEHSGGTQQGAPDSGEHFSLEDVKNEAVKRYLTQIAILYKGNAKEMAAASKLTLPSIYRLLSLHSISIKDFAKDS
jgi:DNA-binding NtrC family response regulator